jgi:hypothetical protein
MYSYPNRGMEKDTLHRGADVINQLLKAHVSYEAEPVDVHDAMAARDELRELARDDPTEYNLPEVGDIVQDTENIPKFGNGRVRVTEVFPNAEARTHYIQRQTGKKSVAYCNPGCDETAPVVKGAYVDGSDKVYTFPADRLE